MRGAIPIRCLQGISNLPLIRQLQQRIDSAGSSLSNAQVSTLRERLLKLAVWVKRSTRHRIKSTRFSSMASGVGSKSTSIGCASFLNSLAVTEIQVCLPLCVW